MFWNKTCLFHFYKNAIKDPKCVFKKLWTGESRFCSKPVPERPAFFSTNWAFQPMDFWRPLNPPMRTFSNLRLDNSFHKFLKYNWTFQSATLEFKAFQSIDFWTLDSRLDNSYPFFEIQLDLPVHNSWIQSFPVHSFLSLWLDCWLHIFFKKMNLPVHESWTQNSTVQSCLNLGPEIFEPVLHSSLESFQKKPKSQKMETLKY